MSLEKILEALEAEARREIDEIERDAQTEVDQIQAQAEKKATVIKRGHQDEVRQRLDREQAQRLNQAKLEALRTELGAREALIVETLNVVADRLAEVASGNAYATLLQRLAQEAVEALRKDGKVQIHVLERDVAVMEDVIEQMELAATVIGVTEEQLKLSSWGALGGLVVLTSDGRIRLTNTLEARLQRVASLHRARIAASLFDQMPEA